ncbi:MAG: hypothetical protein LBT66_04720 [Methanobrevibacter sp.]|nr:hypothetical protein [Candidatus Methanovirga meridionalis]
MYKFKLKIRTKIKKKRNGAKLFQKIRSISRELPMWSCGECENSTED